jgi:hypothetical protein
MYSKHLALGAALCAVFLSTAPAAFAQTAAQNGYSEPAGSVQQQLGGGPAAPDPHAASASDHGRLPFSGLDVGLVGAAGGLLLALGLAGRRLGHAPTP